MSDLRQKFLYYMRKRAGLHDPYIWGGQGEKLRKLSLIDLCNMETSLDNACRVLRYVDKMLEKGYNMSKCKCFDCSGLVTYYLQHLGVITSDMTAQSLYSFSKHKPISEALPGDLIFRGETEKSIVHVGVYMGDMKVIEAKGRDYGVCETAYEDARWSYCGSVFTS